MKQLIIIVCCILMTGCGTTRKVNKKQTQTETSTTSKETGTVESKREGDTLQVLIPNVVYKDTTIFRRGNTTTVVGRYDSQGNLDLKCISDEIDELKTYIKETQEDKKEQTDEKDTEKESIIKPIWFLFFFIGIGFLMLLNKLMSKYM